MIKFLFFSHIYSSGSSSGSSSMVQSFSVDDLQKMRTKLKTSKSYPNDFIRQQNQNRINENNEEGDNSSSGVSSDQEIQSNNNGTPEIKKQEPSRPIAPPVTKQEPQPLPPKQQQPIKKLIEQPQQPIHTQNLKPSLVKTPHSILKNSTANYYTQSEPKKVNTTSQIPCNNVTPVTTRITTSIVTKMMPHQTSCMKSSNISHMQQQQPHYHHQYHQHQQAVTKVSVNKPEPKKLELTQQLSNEQRSDDDDLSPSPPSMGFQRQNSLTRKQACQLAAQRAKAMQNQLRAVSLAQLPPPLEQDSDETDSVASLAPAQVVLAPPPEFCDFHPASQNNPRVRIVGAVPKSNRLHSQ